MNSNTRESHMSNNQIINECTCSTGEFFLAVIIMEDMGANRLSVVEHGFIY